MARAKKSLASQLFGAGVFLILLVVMLNTCSSDTEEPEPAVVTTPEPVVVVTTAVSEEPTSVSNNAPTASFTATPTSGEAPLAVSFNASGSSDSDGSITSYAWSFGDRGIGILPGSTVSHTYGGTYNGTRTYIAQLTVTDNDGATDTAARTIRVSSATPIIGAETLLDEFKANEIAATLKFEGKGISVRGYVDKVSFNAITDEPYVKLVGSPDDWGYSGVRCTFPASASASLAALSKGDFVTIIGTCERYFLSDVYLDGCSMNRF